MSQAQGSKRQVAYVFENTFGITPATPQTKELAFTEFTGNLNAPEVQSQTVRSNRQHTGSRRGNISTEGSFSIELTPGNADDLLESVMQGTWTEGELRIGSNQRSIAFEEGFTDIGQYRVFNGSVLNTLSMEVTPDSYVKASFGFIGKSTSAFTGTSICAVPTPVADGEQFFHEGGVFKEGDMPVGYLSAVKFDLTNNAKSSNALGVTGVRAITSGKAMVTGSVTALFESVDFYNKFVNITESSLEFTLTSGDDSLTFAFPKLKYSNGKITSSGDAGVTVEMSFTAEYDETDDTTLLITRG